jgi:hypothetical protein
MVPAVYRNERAELAVGVFLAEEEKLTAAAAGEVAVLVERTEVEQERLKRRRQLMAGSGKSATEYDSRDDLAALTHEAADIGGIPFRTGVDKAQAEGILRRSAPRSVSARPRTGWGRAADGGG